MPPDTVETVAGARAIVTPGERLFANPSGWRRLVRRWRRSVLPHWQDVRPFVMLALALSVVVLGTFGFHQVGGARYESWANCFYAGLQLFGFGGSVPSPPAALQIARFLGPLIVGYAAMRRRRGMTPEVAQGSLNEWEDLPESLQQSNRRFADGIGAHLDNNRCVIVPDELGGRDDERFHFADEELTSLAEEEHNRWMKDLIADGWEWTDGEKDPEEKLHPKLVPWRDLLPEDQQRDRDLISAVPQMLASVGYEIRRLDRLREERDRSPGTGDLGEARREEKVPGSTPAEPEIK